MMVFFPQNLRLESIFKERWVHKMNWYGEIIVWYDGNIRSKRFILYLYILENDGSLLCTYGGETGMNGILLVFVYLMS